MEFVCCKSKQTAIEVPKNCNIYLSAPECEQLSGALNMGCYKKPPLRRCPEVMT
ncbi:hypothetical protein ACFOG5_24325 [Pedobacter fastidiosus]|uniref:hypothetical protein n=1 Tax=Pedobacter fastidiosus TaxID=2765361 RepID=UPI00360D2D87